MTRNETDNFEAFDLVASALEELELYEASVKALEAEEENISRIRASAKGENLVARSEQGALDKARGYLEDALNETQETPREDRETSKKEKKPKGDKEYFKAYYLLAMTDYFSKNPSGAVTRFNDILNPTDDRATSANRAATKARKTEDKSFVEEVRYNVGAAYFEQGNLAAAISQFDIVIKATEKRDLALELLARSAKALAHARRWQELGKKDESNKAWAEIREVKKHLRKDAIFLFRIRWRNEIILRRREIDQRTGDTIRRIVNEARATLVNSRAGGDTDASSMPDESKPPEPSPMPVPGPVSGPTPAETVPAESTLQELGLVDDTHEEATLAEAPPLETVVTEAPSEGGPAEAAPPQPASMEVGRVEPESTQERQRETLQEERRRLISEMLALMPEEFRRGFEEIGKTAMKYSQEPTADDASTEAQSSDSNQEPQALA